MLKTILARKLACLSEGKSSTGLAHPVNRISNESEQTMADILWIIMNRYCPSAT
jgi:hypothetical protein